MLSTCNGQGDTLQAIYEQVPKILNLKAIAKVEQSWCGEEKNLIFQDTTQYVLSVQKNMISPWVFYFEREDICITLNK